MNYKILAVDDEAANLRMLERVFRGEFEVITATSGAEALTLLTVHDIALIISDQRMPTMSGVEFLKKAAEMRPHCVRIILTGYTDSNDLAEALNSNVVYKYITKPWVNSDLTQTVRRGLAHHETIKAQHRLNSENQRLRERLDASRNGLLQAFNEILKLKSGHAFEHAERTRRHAEAIGRALELNEEHLDRLAIAAQLHEIANIRVPSDLAARAETSAEVLAEVSSYREAGLELLMGSPEIEEAASAIRYVSENFDGSGSPEALSGFQIPLISRILAVACAFEHLTAPAPHGSGMSETDAMGALKSDAGHRFDPNIVNVFCGFQSLNEIRLMMPETELVAG